MEFTAVSAKLFHRLFKDCFPFCKTVTGLFKPNLKFELLPSGLLCSKHWCFLNDDSGQLIDPILRAQ
jgi:hypothetical protein